MMNWSFRHSPLAKGAKFTLRYGKQPLKFGSLFELLATNGEFAAWYSSVLRCPNYPAYFWEHPPMTEASIETPAEFVLLEAPGLERVQADASAFAEHFNAALMNDRNETVVSFPNIGGDALLIAPCPDHSAQPYAHLAAFIRAAPGRQIQAFWRVTAEAVMERLGEKPLWLSTSGLGVAWLHARLDSRPKYYQHRPYLC